MTFRKFVDAGYGPEGIEEKRRKRKALLGQLRTSLDAEEILRDTLGAKNVRLVGSSELVHQCPLPFGLHKNDDATGGGAASLNQDSLLFNCFVCGAGDIFWLVANVLDISIEQAVSELSGMLLPRELSAGEFLAELEAIWEDKNQVAFSMPTYSEAILRPWRRYSEYFTERGITHETQKEYQTGVDLRNREMYEKGDVSEWITRPRIVIPHFFGGALRGWQKRKIDGIKYGPKYKSSQGFPRDSTLYGMDKADRHHALVVESPASVLKLRSQGFESIVGTLGSEVTPEQMNLLSQFDSVTLLADCDTAGRKMAEKLSGELASRTELWIAPEGDEGTDPADRSPEQNKELIDNRVPGALFGVF